MADTRKILKVFLASPGDLKEERQAAKTTVDEINSLVANPFGYHVELIGWEDTVSRFGRPQSLINAELDRCEYFIGMLWKRWGTPPDNKGIYTSGFEEEFERSLAHNTSGGRPEITLFFKEVEPEFLRDPGDELKKVLAFRANLVNKKILLFETFANVSEFEKKLRKCVADYVHALRLKEAAEISGERQVRPGDSGPGVPNDRDPRNALLSESERQFINSFAARAAENDPSAVTMADRARLRLLATIVGTERNDRQALGVHDANILFGERHRITLDYGEMFGLVASGLEYYATENSPLWYWYSQTNTDGDLLAMFSLHGGSDGRRAGALLAMRAIHEPLLSDKRIGRGPCVGWWLRHDETASVKVAALGYLGELGITEDVPPIREELDRNNYQTKAAAVDAILRILLRESRQQALDALYQMQPATVSADLLHELFARGAPFSLESVTAGLSHQAAAVRRMAVKLLQDRHALSVEIAEKLTDDDDASIRCEALKALTQHGRSFSNEEAKKVLVRPARATGLGFGLGQGSPSDPTGEACWMAYHAERLTKLDDASLALAADEETIYNLEAKFVLAERQYRRDGTKLRAAIRDEFKAAFAEELARVEPALAGYGGGLLEKTRSLETYLRKERMRKALDVVCRNDDGSDLHLVRVTLKETNIDYSDADLAYLERFGEWEDIPLITAMTERPDANWPPLLASSSAINEKYRRAAQAMYKIGRSRLPELLAVPMASRLLTYLIVQLGKSATLSLSDGTLQALFHHEDGLVRKAASLVCIKFLPKRRLESLLSEYLSADQWYYNVIHWLDLGVSLPKGRASAAALRAVEREWGRRPD
jgi:HEAT repeat protein